MKSTTVVLMCSSFLLGLMLVSHSTASYRPPLFDSVEPTSAELNDLAADPNKVTLVTSGQWNTANAAWWGFDSNDATPALQSAIDSNAPIVIVPYTGSPWILSAPITPNENQAIVVQYGVEFVAKHNVNSDGIPVGKNGILHGGNNPLAAFTSATVSYVHTYDPCEPTPEQLYDNSVDPNKTNLVSSGAWSTASVAWWGTNATALENAVNSNADTIIVTYKGSPWIINKMIDIPSNKTIILQPGVEIHADDRTQFDTYDPLFRVYEKENVAIIGYGATISMDPNEFHLPKGHADHSEWHHAIGLHKSKNVTIAGVECYQAGGDGLKIGSLENNDNIKCDNVHAIDCKMNANFRQGITCASVKSCYIDRCIMANTTGVSPEAGIDYEIHNNTHVLQDIVMDNCLIYNNVGPGVAISMAQYDANSPAASINIRHTTLFGNSNGCQIIPGTSGKLPTGSSLHFDDLVTTASDNFDFDYRLHVDEPLDVVLANCSFGTCPSIQSYPAIPFRILVYGTVNTNTPGVIFEDSVIIENPNNSANERHIRIGDPDGGDPIVGPDGGYPLLGNLIILSPDPNNVTFDSRLNLDPNNFNHTELNHSPCFP